jgi:hypothetical protein
MKSKHITKKQDQPGRSLKKNLAIAAVAASLGVSLGVPVKDVLAVEGQVSSIQDKQTITSGQLKEDAIQQKLQSKQGKIESKQDKINAVPNKLESSLQKEVSDQGKLESSLQKEQSSPAAAGTVK